MTALSLWQPWASLMAVCGSDGLPYKAHETRGWATSYRGLLAIHAAKRPMDADTRALFREWIEDGLIPNVDMARLPFGAIVAVVELVDCIRTEDISRETFLREWDFGNYEPGRWAWVTRNARSIGPIPWRGAQGLFNVPDAVLRAAGWAA
jgi:hypothetical protein